ncbi:MAG TPA: sulfotransferase [Pirellulales bacterium]|nr:sulfotransferase [Pirellulales bacterium]
MSNSEAPPRSGPKSTEGRAVGRKKSAGREWSPRFWTGMNFSAWCRLLARNRFAVGWRFWPTALAITLSSMFHSAYRRWHWIWMGRHAAKVEIRHEPLFIVGHWRSGTTLLHELLVLDQRHTSPTTYECLVPNHFLLSEDFARRWLTFLLPAQRPMDNMAAGWDRPQEDEFALCNLGLPSPYLRIAFPNHPPQDTEYLTLEGLPAKDLAHWKRVFLGFLRQITYRTPKRIVLKSPPHTCRVKTLLELFPGARFVHIVRDPFVLFPSTMNLWKTLYERHGLQRPTCEGLEEHVFETFERMYQRFETDRGLIASDRLCEVRYEDLVRDPIGNLRAIYEKLALEGFDEVLPALEKYVAATEGYKTNRYELTSQQRDEIARRWGGYMRRYGYANDER